MTVYPDSRVVGDGVINCDDVVNQGVIEPTIQVSAPPAAKGGFTGGTLTITGSLSDTGGTLVFGVGGVGAGMYDQLAVEGDVSLTDTVVELSFAPDVTPRAGR